MHKSRIEQQVMASVGVVYAVRTLVSRTALKVYILGASVWTLAALVWVARIEENFLQVMNGGLLGVGNFVLSAFVHTSTLVQCIALVIIFALGSLASDIIRTFSTPSRYSL